MSADVLIVDLDGTLLDTRARHHAAYAEGVAALGGAPLPLDRFWRAKRAGASWPALLAATLARRLGEGEADGFLAGWAARIEDEALLARDRLQPGAARALRALRGRGFRLVLITARREPARLERQLVALGVRGLFDRVIATGGRPKPAALLATGIGWAEIAGWIGDTEEDREAARSLGVPVWLVTNGIRNRSVLARLQPTGLAASFGAAARSWGRG